MTGASAISHCAITREAGIATKSSRPSGDRRRLAKGETARRGRHDARVIAAAWARQHSVRDAHREPGDGRGQTNQPRNQDTTGALLLGESQREDRWAQQGRHEYRDPEQSADAAGQQ
jgi:hypothetical protein